MRFLNTLLILIVANWLEWVPGIVIVPTGVSISELFLGHALVIFLIALVPSIVAKKDQRLSFKLGLNSLAPLYNW